MKFSIVTPSFNQKIFIEDTIQSVLAQTYRDFEYIIMDGCSTDGTQEVVQKFAGELKKYLSEPDEGQAHAINKGFLFADGEIYAYLNSDDYYFRETLEKVARAFRENPDVDVVYGDCVYTDDNGQFVRYFSEISDFNRQRLLNNTNHIMQPATFWRRRVFEKYGPFDEQLHFGFDWALWCELASNNCKFLRINHVLAANRVYMSTKTSSGGSERLKELKAVNCKYKTKFLPYAYYSFSLGECLQKKKKGIVDYIRVLFYLLLSYQNVIYVVRNYHSKIINGLLPKTNVLLKNASIRLPRLNYSRCNICLSAPENIDQQVSIYASDRLAGRYSFKKGRLEVSIELAAEQGDVDIRFDFDREFVGITNPLLRILLFYRPKYVAAIMQKFEME